MQPEPQQDDTLVDRIATALIAAREGGPKVPADIDGGALRLEDAYPIQRRVAERFGPVGGFKVACKPGEPVILAPILAGDIQRSPGRIETDEQIGMELEYGFKVVGELPRPGQDDYDAQLRRAVALVPVLEIVRTRLTDPDTPSAALKLADNQINGGLVVGTPLRDWQHMDLTQAQARLRLGDSQVLDGLAAVPGGDAFENLRKFLQHLGDHLGGFHLGQVLITGSLNGLPWITPGSDVHAEIEGLGEVSLEFPG